MVIMDAIKKIIKLFLPDWLLIIGGFRLSHGVFPNLIRPATFTEKIAHRMIFDRRPLLTQFTDKAAARNYVASRGLKEILTEVYCLTKDPETIPFDNLPGKFVVKPTHGSGWVKIVLNKTSLNRRGLIETCKGWLTQNYYRKGSEWAYKNIEPQILIEEYIHDGYGDDPTDYKFFVFDGKVRLIQTHYDRHTNHAAVIYTPSWERQNFEFNDPAAPIERPKPDRLDEMLAAAERLGTGIDFVRVDLYATKDRIYFGELTMTPNAAAGRFKPLSYDRIVGDFWKLPPKYPRLLQQRESLAKLISVSAQLLFSSVS
jgi:hypothetical protein